MDPFQDVRGIHKAIIEALLLVSPDPLPAGRIAEVLDGPSEAEVVRMLDELKGEYDRDGHGFQIVTVAGGCQLVTRPEYVRWVMKLKQTRTLQPLSRPALETLAIIAYRQPLIRAEIDDIRGVNSGGVLKNLLERGLVRIAGRKEVPGRPILYATTDLFLRQFGLNTLKDLPTMKDFSEGLGEMV